MSRFNSRKYDFYMLLRLIVAVVLTFTQVFTITAITEAAPLGFSLTAAPASPNTDTQMKLTWTSVANAVYYVIERPQGVPLTVIDVDSSRDYLSYVDSDLTPQTAYSYAIKAYSDYARLTQIGNQASGNSSTTQMRAPTILSSKFNVNGNGSSNHEITLVWKNESLAAEGFVIHDSNGAVKASVADMSTYTDSSTKVTTYTFTDTAADLSRALSYTVTSIDGAGHNSLKSQPVNITPIDEPVITTLIQSGNPVISWGNYPNISNFDLERSKYNGTKWEAWQATNLQLSAGATSITDTQAASGNYRYRLTAKGNYKGTSNISEAVLLPGAPTNLQGSLLSPSKVKLTWTISSSNECSLRLERKTGTSGTYSVISNPDRADLSYEDNTVQVNNTYYYRVVAYDSTGNTSVSNECTVSTGIPTVPSSLKLSVSSGKMTLDWTDTSNNEQGFKVEKKIDSGSFTEIPTMLAAGITTYSDTIVSTSHTYTYRVKAYNVAGNSAYSNEVTGSLAIITAPASLDITPDTSTQVSLKWTYPISGSYATVVERRAASEANWTEIASLSANTYQYTNTGLTAGIQYFYRVRAVLGTGIYSAPYPGDAGKGIYTLLKSPTGFSGYASAASAITLSWNDCTDETQYVIERKSDNKDYTVVGTIGTNVVSWTDKGLTANKKYYYRIKAKNTTNTSEYSETIGITCAYLSNPEQLVGNVISDTSIELEWKDTSNNETGFEIWKTPESPFSWEKIAVVDADNIRYYDTNVKAGGRYFYKIRAYVTTSGLNSNYSNIVMLKTSLPTAPSDLRYFIVTDTQVKVVWEDNTDSESGFKVEMKAEGEEDWTEIASLGPNTESYYCAGLIPHQKYEFRIKVYYIQYSSVNSTYSGVLEVVTGVPESPSDLIVDSSSPKQLKLTWYDNSDNEQGFKIERKGPGEKDYVQIAQVGADAAAFTDTSVKPKAQYYYRVRAYNVNGFSPYCEEQTAATKELVTFDDMKDVSWAREAIENLASKGIIKGKGDKQFAPNDTITRAEFTTLIVRAFKLNRTPIGSFSDVKPGHWFYRDVMTAKRMGVVSGSGSNNFYPNNPITREEMATILGRTMKAVGKPLAPGDSAVLDEYKDGSSVADFAVSSIASLLGENALNIRSDKRIAPKEDATRAEAAFAIYRLVNR